MSESLIRSCRQDQESAEVTRLRQSSTAMKSHSGSMSSRSVGTRCPLAYLPQLEKEVDQVDAKISENCMLHGKEFQPEISSSDVNLPHIQEFKVGHKGEDLNWQRASRKSPNTEWVRDPKCENEQSKMNGVDDIENQGLNQTGAD